MAQRVEVLCIVKKEHYNPHERIHAIGGKNPNGSRWQLPEGQAIQHIKNGEYDFYVNRGGRVADVIIAKHNGREYLKTVADGYSPDNLLSLNSCPIN